MIDTTLESAYWAAVEGCLVRFHHLDPAQAGRLRRDLQERVRRSGDPKDPAMDEMFYHAEPFDIACDLAGRQLDIRQAMPEYKQLLTASGW